MEVTIKRYNKPETAGENFLPHLLSEFAFSDKIDWNELHELRLRAGKTVTAEYANCRKKLNFTVTADYLQNLLERCCDYSVYSKISQLREGYITVKGGHRIGICGTAYFDGSGEILGVKDITSMNIRVARSVKGCADELFCKVGDNFTGLLIIGAPKSAKTTVMRDFVRKLAATKKVCVIDERGELAAKFGAEIANDLGENADVLDGFTKQKGFETATRCLSPDYIACDEIGGDVSAALSTNGSGVGLLLTAHCESIEAALKHRELSKLIDSKRVDHIALLSKGKLIAHKKF